MLEVYGIKMRNSARLGAAVNAHPDQQQSVTQGMT